MDVYTKQNIRNDLHKLVKKYNPDKLNSELDEFKNMAKLGEAIDRACAIDYKIFSHQYRVGRKKLAELRAHIIDSELEKCANFDAVWEVVLKASRNVAGVGYLTVYDVSLRIASYLGFEPTVVYLHSGAMTGAKNLLRITGQKHISREDLPEAFAHLSCAHIENFLCIFKDGTPKNYCCSKKEGC